MEWIFDQAQIDWTALSELYRIAPLGDKKPDELRLAFGNSIYKCFVFENGVLIGAGRAIAGGSPSKIPIHGFLIRLGRAAIEPQLRRL